MVVTRDGAGGDAGGVERELEMSDEQDVCVSWVMTGSMVPCMVLCMSMRLDGSKTGRSSLMTELDSKEVSRSLCTTAGVDKGDDKVLLVSWASWHGM
jgi:hypothetical protein